jgi:hypothetical protein
MWSFYTSSVKDHVKSVLRINSAHNKGGPADISIAQILHLSNIFWIETYSSLYSLTLANQESVGYSVSMSYFTNIAVQNVNKGVYITDLTRSLRKARGCCIHVFSIIKRMNIELWVYCNARKFKFKYAFNHHKHFLLELGI